MVDKPVPFSRNMVDKPVPFSRTEQRQLVSKLKADLEGIADSLDASAKAITGSRGYKFFDYTADALTSFATAFRSPFDKKTFEENVSRGFNYAHRALKSREDYNYGLEHHQPKFSEILMAASVLKEGLDRIYQAGSDSGSPSRMILHPDLPTQNTLLPFFGVPKALSIEVAALVMDANMNFTIPTAGTATHNAALQELRSYSRHLAVGATTSLRLDPIPEA